MASERARAALTAATVTSLAVAQPLLDLLGGAPEFLVAHRATPAAILTLTIVLAVLLPAAAALVAWAAHRAHPAAGRVITSAIVAAGAALILLMALGHGSTNGRSLVAAAAVGGTLAGAAYLRFAAVRAFALWLSPGLVLVPALFLFSPGIRSMVWARSSNAQASSGSQVPVVMVVFDQLPLASLLGADQRIDPALYPSFASLAGGATWYRNATTVSDYTRWALPAMLTGRHPSPAGLPIAAHHRENLFTLLGASHRMHVFEPITGMCPDSICGGDAAPLGAWLRAMARTLRIAYLHAVLPSDLAAGLPPLDQGWNERAPAATEGGIAERWYEEHRKGRRREVLEFIDAIDAGGPELHFLHVLLPHEPFIYFPDGQRFSIETTLPGLIAREMWQDDEWAVTQAYRRHLLQAAYVDALLGRLVERLKATGLYDRALIIVTSDHGASFRSGRAFRRLTPENAADILPVPLVIKFPLQTEGVVDDRNVESIDIVPTIAAALGVSTPWEVNGASATGAAAPRSVKVAFHDDAKQRMEMPGSMLPMLFEAASRKRALFGPGAGRFQTPARSPYREIIGQPLSALRVQEGSDGTFTLDIRGDFSDVDPAGEVLPAYLAGTAHGADDGTVSLAVAVNGRVSVTTRTYGFEERGSHDAWSAVLPPDAFRRGRNDLEVFVVTRDAGGLLLRRVYRSADEALDLSAPAAVYAWGVAQEGLHDREWRGQTPYRWTSDVARITAPIAEGRAPRALDLRLLMSGRDGKPLRVTINGCELFDGPLPAGPWARVFDLAGCPPLGRQAVIELRTEVMRSRNRIDRRWLGVAIERVDLLDAAPAR